MSVDGTYVLIADQGQTFYNHKFMNQIPSSEVEIFTKNGNIVWSNSLYECNRCPDIRILKYPLLVHLQEEETVEADDGCVR